jgi:hypothetical protein
MNRAGMIQSEIGWAKVFLAFLKEAEMEADQVRLRALGVQWGQGPSQHHGSDLVEYFQMLDSRKPEPTVPKGMARAVGSKTVRKS